MADGLLHMVVLRHTPETCPAAHPEMRETRGTRLGQLGEGSAERGVEVLGSWADVAGHTFFFVVEAPNAHAITGYVTELELFHWNTVEVRPVVAMG